MTTFGIDSRQVMDLSNLKDLKNLWIPLRTPGNTATAAGYLANTTLNPALNCNRNHAHLNSNLTRKPSKKRTWQLTTSSNDKKRQQARRREEIRDTDRGTKRN